MNYRDIKDIEEVIPLFISFVDKPANQYGWEVMTYDAYINKNEKDVEEMTEIENKEEMISVSALEKIKGLFVNKSEQEEETVEKAEEEPVITETSTDETVTALFEKLDTIIEQNNQILEAVAKAEEETVDEEEEIEKAEEDEETSSEEKKEEDEEVEKSESKGEGEAESETESEEDEEEDDDVHVDKRETNMIENQTNTEVVGDFYTKTGRDSFGRKIKN